MSYKSFPTLIAIWIPSSDSEILLNRGSSAHPHKSFVIKIGIIGPIFIKKICLKYNSATLGLSHIQKLTTLSNALKGSINTWLKLTNYEIKIIFNWYNLIWSIFLIAIGQSTAWFITLDVCLSSWVGILLALVPLLEGGWDENWVEQHSWHLVYQEWYTQLHLLGTWGRLSGCMVLLGTTNRCPKLNC